MKRDEWTLKLVRVWWERKGRRRAGDAYRKVCCPALEFDQEIERFKLHVADSFGLAQDELHVEVREVTS